MDQVQMDLLCKSHKAHLCSQHGRLKCSYICPLHLVYRNKANAFGRFIKVDNLNLRILLETIRLSAFELHKTLHQVFFPYFSILSKLL